MAGKPAAVRRTSAAFSEAVDRARVTGSAAASLRVIRTDLRRVGANEAADYVARALKSVEGAERHANRLYREADTAYKAALAAAGWN